MFVRSVLSKKIVTKDYETLRIKSCHFKVFLKLANNTFVAYIDKFRLEL